MQPAPSKCVWVIIPAYNEIDVVSRVVIELKRRGHAVLLVDDGSTDATAATAETAGAVVVASRRLGSGRAARRVLVRRSRLAGVTRISTRR